MRIELRSHQLLLLACTDHWITLSTITLGYTNHPYDICAIHVSDHDHNDVVDVFPVVDLATGTLCIVVSLHLHHCFLVDNSHDTVSFSLDRRSPLYALVAAGDLVAALNDHNQVFPLCRYS